MKKRYTPSQVARLVLARLKTETDTGKMFKLYHYIRKEADIQLDNPTHRRAWHTVIGQLTAITPISCVNNGRVESARELRKELDAYRLKDVELSRIAEDDSTLGTWIGLCLIAGGLLALFVHLNGGLM